MLTEYIRKQENQSVRGVDLSKFYKECGAPSGIFPQIFSHAPELEKSGTGATMIVRIKKSSADNSSSSKTTTDSNDSKVKNPTPNYPPEYWAGPLTKWVWGQNNHSVRGVDLSKFYKECGAPSGMMAGILLHCPRLEKRGAGASMVLICNEEGATNSNSNSINDKENDGNSKSNTNSNTPNMVNNSKIPSSYAASLTTFIKSLNPPELRGVDMTKFYKLTGCPGGILQQILNHCPELEKVGTGASMVVCIKGSGGGAHTQTYDSTPISSINSPRNGISSIDNADLSDFMSLMDLEHEFGIVSSGKFASKFYKRIAAQSKDEGAERFRKTRDAAKDKGYISFLQHSSVTQFYVLNNFDMKEFVASLRIVCDSETGLAVSSDVHDDFYKRINKSESDGLERLR